MSEIGLKLAASILKYDGSTKGAEDVLMLSLAEAKAIGTSSFELRTANDLATIFLEPKRPDDALGLLDPLLTRFGKGFINRDIRVATELFQRAMAG